MYESWFSIVCVLIVDFTLFERQKNKISQDSKYYNRVKYMNILSLTASQLSLLIPLLNTNIPSILKMECIKRFLQKSVNLMSNKNLPRDTFQTPFRLRMYGIRPGVNPLTPLIEPR